MEFSDNRIVEYNKDLPVEFTYDKYLCCKASFNEQNQPEGKWLGWVLPTNQSCLPVDAC